MQLKIRQDKSFMVLSICLVLGLVFSLLLLKYNYFIGGCDACGFALAGKNLVSGQRPFTAYQPLYPLLIGIFYKFMGNLELAAHTVSIIFFLVSIAFFFKLAGYIYNNYVASLATILFVTNQLILNYSYRVRNHSVDILLIIIAIYLASLIIKNEELQYKNFIFLGAILACTILNRPENIILTLAIITTVFVQKKKQTLRKAVAFACLIIVLMALLFPHVKHLHTHTGKWTLTTRIRYLQMFEYLSSMDPLAYEKKQKVDKEFNAFTYTIENRGELLKRYRRGIILSSKRLYTILYSGFGFILIGLGLFGQAWDRDRKRIEVLLFSCMAILAIYPLGNVGKRYFLCCLPIFLMWIAKGLENLYIFIKNFFNLSDKKSAFVISVALSLLILPLASFLVSQITTPSEKRLPLEYKQVGLWMKDNIQDIEKKRIFSRKPWVAFYAGGKFIKIPFEEDYSEFIDILKRRKGDYLVIDERLIPSLRPHLKFLLDDQAKHKGLVRVYVIEKPKKIILYRIE